MDSDLAEKVEQERDRYRQLYLDALERCRMPERGLLGQKSERLPSNEAQLALQVLGGMLEARDGASEGSAPPPEPKTQQMPAHERRARSGRQMLPEELPRVEIEVVPDEVQREGLDAYERIGGQVSGRPHRPAEVCPQGSGAERRDQGAHGAAGRAPDPRGPDKRALHPKSPK